VPAALVALFPAEPSAELCDVPSGVIPAELSVVFWPELSEELRGISSDVSSAVLAPELSDVLRRVLWPVFSPELPNLLSAEPSTAIPAI
jgi:hypothetical protein